MQFYFLTVLCKQSIEITVEIREKTSDLSKSNARPSQFGTQLKHLRKKLEKLMLALNWIDPETSVT